MTEAEFDEHVREERPVVFRYLLKRTGNPESAEDLTQEVFLRAAKFKAGFDSTKGTFGAWVQRIAHNTMISQWARDQKAPQQQSIDGPGTPELASGDDESRIFDQNFLQTEIKNAIERLPEPERSVVFRKEMKQEKLADIADGLGLSVRTVSRRLISAYDLLRTDLAARGITPGGMGGGK